MAPPKKPWLRLYTAMPSDRKIRRLKPEHRWVWVCVLCAARESPIPGELWVAEGEPMTLDELADIADVSRRMARTAVESMEDLGLITTGEVIAVPRFGDRQFESDSSTNRVRKHRSKPVDNSVDNSTPGASSERVQSEFEAENELNSTRKRTEREPKTSRTEVANPREQRDSGDDVTVMKRPMKRRCNAPDTDTDTDTSSVVPRITEGPPMSVGNPEQESSRSSPPDNPRATVADVAVIIGTAAHEHAVKHGGVTHRDNHRRACIRSAHTEHATRIARLIADYPTLDAAHIADIIRGRRTPDGRKFLPGTGAIG